MTQTFTKTQIIKRMAQAGIVPVAVRGRGVAWEVELQDDKAQRAFTRKVAKVGGYSTGWGGWVLRPGYKCRGDWNDRTSRHHY